ECGVVGGVGGVGSGEREADEMPAELPIDRVQPARMPSSGIVEIGSEKQLFLDRAAPGPAARLRRSARPPPGGPASPGKAPRRPAAGRRGIAERPPADRRTRPGRNASLA